MIISYKVGPSDRYKWSEHGAPLHGPKINGLAWGDLVHPEISGGYGPYWPWNNWLGFWGRLSREGPPHQLRFGNPELSHRVWTYSSPQDNNGIYIYHINWLVSRISEPSTVFTASLIHLLIFLCRWWHRSMVLKHHQIGQRHWKPLYRIRWKSCTRTGHTENEKSCKFHRKDGLNGQVMFVCLDFMTNIETLAEKRHRRLSLHH